jgi:hypothetical protein
VSDGLVERSHLLGRQPQRVFLAAHVGGEQHGLARLQLVAGGGEQVGEHGGFVDAALVGELDEGEAVAARGGALLSAHHHAGQLARVEGGRVASHAGMSP